ncbi:MAG: sulfotransferase [Myxococcota bacterium]
MSRGSAENQAAFADDQVIADAKANTGLDDFGEDAFREPLEVLLRSLREEAPLNEIGRMVLRGRVVESLETRLQTQDWIKRHPEILEEEIGAPIVVVGLMRTGTTMLHRIISRDPRNYAADWWETRFPAPHPNTDWSKPDPRIPIAEAEVAAILEADPRQASIHPWNAQAPDEEIMLLEHSFLSHVPEAFVNIPTYRSWINEQDWTPAYVYLKKLLQSLQWQKRQRGDVRERWVLKTPGHLGYLDTLFDVFPGARVIQTHRDPVETVPSAASMNHAMWALYSETEEANQAGAQWQERLAWGTLRAMESRTRYAEDRFADIWFRDAMKDPISEIERAYGIFGIEMTAAARAGMEQWRVDNPRDKRPPHEYTLSDYGLTEEGIKTAFGPYRKDFIEPHL